MHVDRFDHDKCQSIVEKKWAEAEGRAGLDIEQDLSQSSKDAARLPLCCSLALVCCLFFLSFGAQGEIMIIRERKSYYSGCSLIM